MILLSQRIKRLKDISLSFNNFIDPQKSVALAAQER